MDAVPVPSPSHPSRPVTYRSTPSSTHQGAIKRVASGVYTLANKQQASRRGYRPLAHVLSYHTCRLQRCLIAEPSTRCAAPPLKPTLKRRPAAPRRAAPRRAAPLKAAPHAAAAARRRRRNGGNRPADAAPPGPLYKGLGRLTHGRHHGPHEPDAALIAASLRRLHFTETRRLQE